MMHGSNGMMYGGFWLMLLVGILVAVLLGLAIYVAVRVNAQPRIAEGMVERTAPSPRDILDLRLAHGEISPEEHSSARALLAP
jgi:uncharacterized membrane protein